MRFLYCACAISAILSDSAITNRVAPTSTAATPSTDAAADSKAPAATASPALTTETKDDVPTVLKELTASAAAIKFPFDVDRAVSYVRSCQVMDVLLCHG